MHCNGQPPFGCHNIPWDVEVDNFSPVPDIFPTFILLHLAIIPAETQHSAAHTSSKN